MLTNLVLNPAMVATSGTVEVRRNLCTNPSFELGRDDWVTNRAWLSAVTDWSTSGTQSAKVANHDNNSNEQGDIRAGSASSFPFGMEPGKTYTVSADLWTPVAHNSFVQSGTSRQRRIILGYSQDSSTSTLLYGEQSPNDTNVHRVSNTFTIPADATGALIVLGSAGSDLDPNFVQYWDSVLVEETSEVRPYFDGSTASPAPDLTASWAGTANASASVLTGARVADINAPTADQFAPAFRATGGPEGATHFARFRVLKTGAIAFPTGNVNPPTGELSTLLAWIRAPRDYSMVQMRIRGAASERFGLPANEWVQKRLTIEAGTSTAVAVSTGFLFEADGGHQPGDLIDVALVMLTEGEYNGLYRDGDSRGWQWDGAPHASTSTQFFSMTVVPVPVMEPVPHNRIVVEGLPDLTSAVTVNVLRMTTDGETVIRGGWQVTATSAFTVDDVEAPFGVETRYRLELFDADGVSLGWTEPTEPVTLDFAGTLIQNCLDADLNATVIHMAGSGQSHARGRGGEVVAAPNRAPYWVGSGVRTVSTRLIFRVYDEEERSKLAQLVGGYGDSVTEVLCMRTTDPLHLGSPFYMLATQPETHGVDWRWGGDITESVWDVVEVQPPGLGLSRALLSWDGVMTAYPTWQAVMDSYPSWAALMQDRSLIGRA